MSYLRELMKSTAALSFAGKSSRRERKLRRDLTRFGQMLHSMGFVAATDGNLSVRLDGSLVLVSPICIMKVRMRTEDMVVVYLYGKKPCGIYNSWWESVMQL